jgi:hypothetical protein
MHTHPIEVGIRRGKGKRGPSVPDFNTLYANPTAIGWIKAKIPAGYGPPHNYYFGNLVYPEKK